MPQEWHFTTRQKSSDCGFAKSLALRGLVGEQPRLRDERCQAASRVHSMKLPNFSHFSTVEIAKAWPLPENETPCAAIDGADFVKFNMPV